MLRTVFILWRSRLSRLKPTPETTYVKSLHTPPFQYVSVWVLNDPIAEVCSGSLRYMDVMYLHVATFRARTEGSAVNRRESQATQTVYMLASGITFVS